MTPRTTRTWRNGVEVHKLPMTVPALEGRNRVF